MSSSSEGLREAPAAVSRCSENTVQPAGCYPTPSYSLWPMSSAAGSSPMTGQLPPPGLILQRLSKSLHSPLTLALFQRARTPSQCIFPLPVTTLPVLSASQGQRARVSTQEVKPQSTGSCSEGFVCFVNNNYHSMGLQIIEGRKKENVAKTAGL